MGNHGAFVAIASLETAIADAQNGTDNFTALRVTEIHDTALNAKVIAISPGHATPVNYWRINGSGASEALAMDALGTATNLDISFTPKGTGKLMESLTEVAINCGSTQADSTAILLADLVTDFNALLARLRTARVLDV